ncbi:MAG: magnesium transporter [Pirellulaceae bacterium]|nr:magnesium transporter [Pirellulaceae bacterium]
MINVLLLPELREMLATQDQEELQQFCTALNPTRTAEFMEGLTHDEAWQVLQATDVPRRAEIFQYFDHDRQIALLSEQDLNQVAELVAELYADDRVDLLQEMDQQRVQQLLDLLPRSDRREIQRLQAYPAGTAGSLMTTEMARLGEHLNVREALDALSQLGEQLETIYYIYVVDAEDKLRGVVSSRQLISSLARPHTRLADLMQKDVLTALAIEDQESVAKKVEKLDLLAIPVIDDGGKLVGIITHDDVIDVVREELTEDAQRIGAIAPLREEYLKISLLLLSWKRGAWLTVLFITALVTAYALQYYERTLEQYGWLVFFLPLIVSTGGNSGNQAATLVITALTGGEISVKDWMKVLVRESLIGALLGGLLAVIGTAVGLRFAPSFRDACVIPLTIILVVTMGCLAGSMLPLILRRLGLDPALMANPFIAGIMDITGIVIYLNVAMLVIG